MGASASNAQKAPARAAAAAKLSYGDVSPAANLQSLSWASVGGDLIADLVAWVNVAGDAVTFATGAKGRWLSVTILTGDGPVKRRYDSVDEAVAGLIELIEIAKSRAS